VQHPKTNSSKPDVDPLGAEPLVGSSFENEPTEPESVRSCQRSLSLKRGIPVTSPVNRNPTRNATPAEVSDSIVRVLEEGVAPW